MNDIRAQLPECPLAYEVPYIPATHTALVIPIRPEGIDWQEKMLPWTLASLINNTDLIMNGVHLYIECEDRDPENRIKNALKHFDLPEGSIVDSEATATVLLNGTYDAVRATNINYWAFRDAINIRKLIFSEIQSIDPYPPPPKVSSSPRLYDMTHCTVEQFRHAIKHLLGAQLGIRI